MKTKGKKMSTRVSGIAARVVALAAVAGIAFFPVVASAVDPGPKCQAAKLNTSAKQPKCRANVFAKSISKSETPDAVKLAKCDDKFNGGFTKAEDKGGVDCPTTGDASLIESVLDPCIDGIVTDLGGAPGAGGDEAKCQSKKAKEVGKYAQCRLKADSTAIKKGTLADYSKCNSKLSDKWTKIEAKPPCLTTNDLNPVKADVDACEATVAFALTGLCGNGNLDAGEQCDDGNTTSGDGCSNLCVNEPLVEYTQNFESLNQADSGALSGNGWKVFGNVFAGNPPGGYLYGYGPFAAPNGGPGFCGIDIGQGGPAQGNQQLVVYSDYNNPDHGNGNTIEANVFQERTIVAGDVGRTLTFQFDRKRGNINDPSGTSTALAFIKTLNPGAGYALVDFITVDMTSIPATWGTSSITLDIDAGRVGFVLQYGFSNQATLYQPSGIFYDNIVASTLPTTP